MHRGKAQLRRDATDRAHSFYCAIRGDSPRFPDRPFKFVELQCTP
jgi:hypothetical protein